MGTANENQQKATTDANILVPPREVAEKRTNIMESQDWIVLGGIKNRPVPTPCMGRDAFH